MNDPLNGRINVTEIATKKNDDFGRSVVKEKWKLEKK